MTALTHRRAIGLAIAASLALPDIASAAPLSVGAVFQNSAIPVKVIAIGLVLATLVAVVICAVKLASGRLSGGSAYLSGLRLGGPLTGLVGAALTGLIMALNLTNATVPVTAQLLAPGIAEAMMLILLGLLTGMVAVLTHWVVEARIDRAVLNG